MLAAGAALAADPGPLAFAPDAPLAAPPARVVAGSGAGASTITRGRRHTAATRRRGATRTTRRGATRHTIDFGYSAVGYAYGGGFASATAPFPGAPRGHAAPA
jgi:hypothetical protein